MGLFSLLKPSRKVLVVDTVALNESLGMKGKVPPRNQLQLLRRLSRFSQREKLPVVAVLTGAPLNKAPSGEKFEGITVVYSHSPDRHAKCLAKVAASKRGILVSGNAVAEKMLGSSARKMHISTFRKVFETCGENDTQDRGDHPRSRGSRPPRRRQARSAPSAAPKQDRPARQDRPPKDVSDADAINELIDLVD